MKQKDLLLFNEIVHTLLKEEKESPVSPYLEVDQVSTAVDVNLTENPLEDNEVQEIIKKVVLKTPRTASKAFFNQLFGGRNSRAVLGDLLAVVLNNSMYTYKVAGIQVAIEKEIINQVVRHIGYNQNAGGTIATGGSMTNFMAMVMARDNANQDIRTKGVKRDLIIYTSNQSHYSIPKNASFMGVGTDNVRYIATNNKGEMLVEDLEQQIKIDLSNNKTPFFVNATAGTTVLGAFDPISAISDVSRKYGLWLHVDGAFGGGVFFSNNYKKLLNGIEYSNSFSFNAHKMLGTPLSCSIIVVQQKQHLYQSFAKDASYLYQTDHDDFDLGKISLQCGRRNDALKFWTLWKSVGTVGLANMVDHQFLLAETARDYIKKSSDYTLYSFDDSTNICFNYKNICPQHLCTLLYEEAALMVGFGHFKDNTFVRLTTVNAENSEVDILNFFTTLEGFVEQHMDVLNKTS